MRSSPLVYLVPVLAAVLLYAPTVGYQLTFDDHQVELPRIQESRSLTDCWTQPSWQSMNGTVFFGYRPVVRTSFLLEELAGLPVPARRALNVLLHGLVTVLLVRLALSLGLGTWGAGLAGLLFAVHPVHVEAVVGLVGRAETLAMVWMLLALWLHDRPVKRGSGPATFGGARPAALLWATVLAFLAAGSKESAWALPLLAGVFHLVRARPWAAAWPAWAGYGAGIVAHLLFRHAAIGGWLNSPGLVITPFDNPLVVLEGLPRFLGGLRILGHNLGHLVFPRTLAPDYSGGQIDVTGAGGGAVLLGGVLLLAGAVAALVGPSFVRSGRDAIRIGGAWLLIHAVLFMNLVYTLATVLADRVLYAPSAGWVLVLGGLASRFLVVSRVPGKPERSRSRRARTPHPARRRSPFRWGAIALLSVLAVAYTVRAAAYLPAWRNDRTLFEASVAAAPRVPRAWQNLGRIHQAEGRYEDAIRAFRNARRVAPGLQEAWAQEASTLMLMERWEEAREPLRVALGLNPEDPISLMNEGTAWLFNGEREKAAQRFTELLAGDPGLEKAAFNLALARTWQERPGEAVEAWERYLEMRPDHAAAQNYLAWLLATEMDRPAEAEPLARRAVAAEPENAGYHDTLAEALFAQGKRAEAIEALEEAVRLDETPYFREKLARFREGSNREEVSP